MKAGPWGQHEAKKWIRINLDEVSFAHFYNLKMSSRRGEKDGQPTRGGDQAVLASHLGM